MAVASSAQPKIGVFGGAFDPPHLAHTGLIEAALGQLRLTELRVIPTGHAWHKPRPLSAATHRLAMARLAFGHVPGVQLDEREIHRPGPTYTIDTLRQLQAEQPQAQLLLLLGADQAAALPTWHEASEIARLAHICVAERAVSGSQGDSNSLPAKTASERGPWQYLALALSPISATEIRLKVRLGQSLTHLVAPAVARYIQDNHLYQGVE
ncbi:MAG: nicotinate (nicotinamide) nucleotide adenylyltransferase [Burkholderiales bacterium]